MFFKLLLFLIGIISNSPVLSAQEKEFASLFQNKFFNLSTDEQLLCTPSTSGFFSNEKLKEIIAYYERYEPDLRKSAVEFLTHHTHSEHLTDLKNNRTYCKNQHRDELCDLEEYWDSKESALRVLALFYDTKTIIKHNNDYDFPRFEDDHIRSFEKGIRKIPPFMREFITKAKPIRNLDNVFKKNDIDAHLQELILAAFPDDTETRVWLDGTQPLSIIPGTGFINQVVAQVFSGSNSIIFTIKNFDKAKENNSYKDLGLTYLVDFRIPLIVHELGHVIDNFHFWDGKEDLYFFFWYRKVSTDIVFIHLIKDSKLALWPSKWFTAFEYMWEINNGRYNGKINEKMAELFAQYILIPQQLKAESLPAYQWLRDDIFRGIEYSGYEACTTPLVRDLTWWENATARALGK